MKITLAEIKNAEAALKKLVTLELPVKTSYRLSKLVKAIDSELNHFESERVKLVKKYGTEDTEHNWTVNEANMTEFGEAMNALGALEADLNYEPLNVDALGDINISVLEMLQLEAFIN